MITVAHLLSDAALGGVTRFLDALGQRLGPRIRQTRYAVTPETALPARLDADVVVLHFTMSWSKLPYLLMLRARRRSRPIALVEHSYSEAFERTYVSAPWRFRAMLRLTYALCDRVVAVSYGQAAWMRRARLLPATKLTVISPFTDCSDLNKLPYPQTTTAPLRLGAYGRYSAQKNFPLLIAAMRHVDPSVATLTMRGFGPDTAALRTAADALPHVIVGDKIDDLAAFLETIDAVVVPSSYEPFGQVALEARLAGRPVIVANIDGLPEQVDQGAGFIFASGDEIALAADIAAMAEIRAGNSWPAACHAARRSAAAHIATSTDAWTVLLHQLRSDTESASKVATQKQTRKNRIAKPASQ
jgi:glycosyltransferase involved in cell wall biosynthesis